MPAVVAAAADLAGWGTVVIAVVTVGGVLASVFGVHAKTGGAIKALEMRIDSDRQLADMKFAEHQRAIDGASIDNAALRESIKTLTESINQLRRHLDRLKVAQLAHEGKSILEANPDESKIPT